MYYIIKIMLTKHYSKLDVPGFLTFEAKTHKADS